MRDSRLVYSTDSGRIPAERAPGGKRSPGKPKDRPGPTLPADGVVRLFRERGQRGGKTVTVIRGLPGRAADLEAHMVALKRLCGAGGTLRDGAIEIQGDHRERIAENLRGQGFQVKLAGG